MLGELGAGRNRLVESTAGAPLPTPPPLGDRERFAGTPVRLTEQGRGVLAGGADRVELLPLDRFVGGVHMLSGAPWRWDWVTRVLVAPLR